MAPDKEHFSFIFDKRVQCTEGKNPIFQFQLNFFLLQPNSMNKDREKINDGANQ
jgi:hypothetical protein